MPLVKKKPIKKVLIGNPEGFRREPLPLELQYQLDTPSLRGGCNVELGTATAIGVRWDENNLASVRTLRHPVEKTEPLNSTQHAAPLVSYRHTESAGSTLRPFRMNPSIPKAASPPIFELDAHEAKLVDRPVVRSHVNSTRYSRTKIPNQDGSTRSSSETQIDVFSSPDKDVPSRTERIPPSSLSSSGLLPIVETDQRMLESESRNQVSQPFATDIPVEMREPREIYQHYRATNNIKVNVSPQAIDESHQFTWTHCWGLFNLYHFAVCSRDIEFADRVIDLIRDSLVPAKAPDGETILLVFEGENISSRLKLIVADWYVSDPSKSFHYRVSQTLPQGFLAFVLQAMKEHGHMAGWSPEPCRYHRHQQPEACYLRKWVQERDRRVVLNRKARKTRLALEMHADAEPTPVLPMFCDRANTEEYLDALEHQTAQSSIAQSMDDDSTYRLLHEERNGRRSNRVRPNRSKSIISRSSGRRSPVPNSNTIRNSTITVNTPRGSSRMSHSCTSSSGSIRYSAREENSPTMSLRSNAYNTLPGSYPESIIDV